MCIRRGVLLMLCPRRDEMVGPFKLPEQDEWRDGRCSFCGSIAPDMFLTVAEMGAELGPTDKDYKVYVEGAEHRKFYFQHLDEAGKRHFVELLNAKKLNIGSPGHFYVLPFFMRRGP